MPSPGCLQPTYEGLKLGVGSGPFPASGAGLQPTYEGLKPVAALGRALGLPGLQPTYEGLKRGPERAARQLAWLFAAYL